MIKAKSLGLLFATFSLLGVANKASAAVTYLNCPTLTPLPVTSFMPAAMMPIYNAENAFDIGMNQVVRQAVSTATQMQIEGIGSSFNSIMTSMIETSQAYQQNKMEIERQFQELEMAYEADVAARKEELSRMLFPGDASMMRPKEGEVRVIDKSSPSYKFIYQMCSAGKMQQMMTSKKVVEKALENKNRRSQKIVANIQAVSSVNAVAKGNVDKHYDIFCSEGDVTEGLCETPSMTPNADLDAYVFLYPTGYKNSAGGNSTNDYVTMYTYSPVESLAAYQYIKNLTGFLSVTPPTKQELENPHRIRFAAAYKQLVAAMSLSSDTMLSIAQNREPINNEGLIMGHMDAVNYMIERTKMPEHRRVLKSASESGKLVEMQRQLSIQQALRAILIKQKDRERQLKAAHLALDNTLNID